LDYDFACPTRFHRLFQGMVIERGSCLPAGRTGTEHLTIADTVDGTTEVAEEDDHGSVCATLRETKPYSARANALGVATLEGTVP
jgi:hypothetical protein